MLLSALAFVLNSAVVAPPKPVPAVSASDDPPIRVWLDGDSYHPGDRATLKIRLSDDGYVVVLRADGDGHLRVLFPLDPGTDNFVKGGKTFEVRGRGDREAFQVDDQNGTGTIFAAVSAQPFTFSGYVLGDHWDYKVLGNEDLGSDPEAAMVDLVHNMAGQNHFDYDVTTYTVSTQVAYDGGGDYSAPSYYPTYYPCWGCGPWYGGSGIFVNFRFGHPFYGYYNSCYYDPFWCDGFDVPFYGAYYYRPYYGYGYFHPRYAFSGPRVYRPFAPSYRPPFGVPRTTTVTSVGVRSRFTPRGGSTVARGGVDGRGGFGEGRRGGSMGGSPSRGAAPSRGNAPSRPEARPAQPSGGGRSQPEPRRGRGNNGETFTRPNTQIRQEPMRPAPRMESPRMESRPAPRMESRPAPRMEAPRFESRPAPRMESRPSSPAPRSFSAPSFRPSAPAPAPRGGGGGGGGGGGRRPNR